MPDVERRRRSAVMEPALDRPKDAENAEAREVLGFLGVTQSRKGRIAARPAKKADGRLSGS